MTRARDVSTPTALVLVKTQTIGTAVSSVTVSGAFSATFDNYRVTITNGSSSATTVISLRFGAANSAYFAAYSGVLYGAAASVESDNNASSFSRFIFGTADGLICNIDVLGPNLAKNTFVVGAQIADQVARAGMGRLNNVTQFTAFTITPLTGTLTGGTIRVYGYQN